MISGFGPHRSGDDSFAGEESFVTGLSVANWIFKGVESPKEAIISDSLRDSAYNN